MQFGYGSVSVLSGPKQKSPFFECADPVDTCLVDTMQVFHGVCPHGLFSSQKHKMPVGKKREKLGGLAPYKMLDQSQLDAAS